MTRKREIWGKEEKKRSKERLKYFLKYRRQRYEPKSLGYKGEIYAQEILKGSRLIYSKIDIKWGGKTIDIKTSKPIENWSRSRKKPSLSWKFYVKTQRKIADYFLLIGMDKYEIVKKVFFIPDSQIYVNTINIGIRNSKYNKFLIEMEVT